MQQVKRRMGGKKKRARRSGQLSGKKEEPLQFCLVPALCRSCLVAGLPLLPRFAGHQCSCRCYLPPLNRFGQTHHKLNSKQDATSLSCRSSHTGLKQNNNAETTPTNLAASAATWRLTPFPLGHDHG